MQKYANVFTGLGRLEKPYHIEVDPAVTPVVNPPRTIPAALRDRVKTELEDMEKRGVIRKVEEPTDWVSSMAIVEKPDGSLRICLDPRHLNKAIKREHFQLPTIEDITTRMANAKWFTKLDANRGYWESFQYTIWTVLLSGHSFWHQIGPRSLPKAHEPTLQ